MKKLAILITFSLTVQVGLAAGALATKEVQSFRSVNHKAFKVGEKLRYRMHYGVIDAGEAVLEVKSTSKTVKGRPLLHMVGKGRTLGSFNWFFKVRDRYETYVDQKGVFPWMFVRRVDEGGFKINQDYVFKQGNKKVDNGDGKQFDVPFGVQDMLSSFYYARTLDFKNAKVGKEFEVEMFIDDEIYPFKVKYLGDETIKTRKGKFKCHKIRPIVMKGRIWEKEEDMTMWITADQNKIPIQVKSKILVGSIKATLVGWEGLANPISKIK